MLLKEIREIARDRGIKGGKMSKEQLIKQIQRDEGNFDCFGTALDGFCDQCGCSWREDCLIPAKSA